ncbi:MAG: TolC family outer membrane protein [Geminicoccaceae bacterium]|nr:TolC family outer membrane protein [Geminicoccaceae bacterium]
MGRTSAWGVGLLVAGLLGTAAPAGAAGLKEALEGAYANNPDLAAARAELRAVRENLSQAQGGWLPQVSAKGSATYTDVKTSIVADNLSTKRAALNLSQNLFAGGGTLAEISSAESLIARQESLLADTEQQVLFNTVQVYTAVFRDQKILEASAENVRRLEQQLQATRTRFSVGEATRSDLAQGEARVIGARADLAQSRSNLAGSIAAFERYAGFTPDSLARAPLPDVLPATLDAAAALIENNPGLRSLTFRLAQAQADVDVAAARLLPSLDVEGELSYVDEPSVFTDWERDAAVGVTLTVPLYQRGVAWSRLRQSRQVVGQRRQELADFRRQTIQSLRTAFERLRGAVDQVAYYEEQVQAYQRALDAVEQEVQIGNRPIIDLLDAQQELFGAQVSLERAKRERTVAAYDIKSSIGEAGAADLGLDVAAAVNEGLPDRP